MVCIADLLTKWNSMRLSTRITIAVIVGIIAAILCYNNDIAYQRGGGDIGTPICMGRVILANQDPYTTDGCGHSVGANLNHTNPLTAVVLLLPLGGLSPSMAAGVFFGLISALLAYAVTHNGPVGLLIFVGFPYWHALQTVQWAPLLVSAALLPALLPLALAKPHLALPILATRLTIRRLVACLVFLALTFMIDPLWPVRMVVRVPMAGEYLPPILLLPVGPALLLAGLRWRSERGRFLLLLACTPQRMFYDALLLWLLPRTYREYLLMGSLSWLSYFGSFFFPQGGSIWSIAGIYLPMLALIWRDSADIIGNPRRALSDWWKRFWQT